jgi:serine/threonine-protein kinase
MTGENSGWVDSSNWRDRWQVEKNLSSGAQGNAFKARRTCDGQIAFLKTIRNRTDPERRARFFREASAYDTFRVAGVPNLIESNAHKHKDSSFDPYIATQFIEGPTLRVWRESQSSVDLETAVAATRSLLIILQECHLAGCVHRDVKPDNIILANSSPANVTLLDFGLNYHEMPDIDFQTEHWQEVGNRFLRLPELSAGSRLKQDPRSDLSFAAGMLFYLLTGEHPDVLQDGEGRLPHQRSKPLVALRKIAGERFGYLASTFDSAFAPLLVDRYPNAENMLSKMDRMMEKTDTNPSPEDDLAAILELINTGAQRRKTETSERLTDALNQVDAVFRELKLSFQGALSLAQTGFHVSGDVGRNTLIWCRAGTDDRLLSIAYEARQAGDEIVISMLGETVFRTSTSDPNYDSNFKSSVRNWVLAHVRAAIADPGASVQS